MGSTRTRRSRTPSSPARSVTVLPTDNLFDTLGIDRVNLIYPSNANYQIAANHLNRYGFGTLIGQPLAVTGRVFDFGLRKPKTKRRNGAS